VFLRTQRPVDLFHEGRVSKTGLTAAKLRQAVVTKTSWSSLGRTIQGGAREREPAVELWNGREGTKWRQLR